ncbi:MAG: hypothetical protein JRN52_03535 [Nitrososphaerota archaeon]|nr:hypothetical protein [Nitrososphaerota archaeon]
MKKVSAGVKKVYGYFNNHFHGYAVENSLELLEAAGLASELQRDALKQIHDKRRESEYSHLVQNRSDGGSRKPCLDRTNELVNLL